MAGQTTVTTILSNLRANLDISDHTVFLKHYPASWTGSDAVTILSREHSISRVAGVELGQMLLDDKHFKSATGDTRFEDSPTALYQFPSDLPRPSAFDMSRLTSAFGWLFSSNEEDASSSKLKTALERACVKNDAEEARRILKNVDVNDHLNDEGWTAMHFAAKCGAVDVLTLLVDLGADVDAGSADLPEFGDSCTPLMVASVYGKLAIVSLLCEEYRADVLITNDLGQTAMQLASRTEHQLIYKYLTRCLEYASPARARVRKSDPFPRTPSRSHSPASSRLISDTPTASSPLPMGRSNNATAFVFGFGDGIEDDEKIVDGYDTPNEFSHSKSDVLETIIASQEQELHQLRNLLHERNRRAEELATRVDDLDRELKHVRAVSVSGKLVVGTDLEDGIDYYDDDVDSDADLM